MIPSWAHTYSSYMTGMQHYVSVENYRSGIAVTNATVDIKDGYAIVQSGPKRRRLSVRLLATRLYRTTNRTANVNITIRKDAIVYKMQKQESLQYLIDGQAVEKNDWFDKLFPEYEYDGKVILDNIKTPYALDSKRVCMIRQGNRVFYKKQRLEPIPQWVFAFKLFFNWNTITTGAYDELPEQAKELVRQIPWFKEQLGLAPPAPVPAETPAPVETKEEYHGEETKDEEILNAIKGFIDESNGVTVEQIVSEVQRQFREIAGTRIETIVRQHFTPSTNENVGERVKIDIQTFISYVLPALTGKLSDELRDFLTQVDALYNTILERFQDYANDTGDTRYLKEFKNENYRGEIEAVLTKKRRLDKLGGLQALSPAPAPAPVPQADKDAIEEIVPDFDPPRELGQLPALTPQSDVTLPQEDVGLICIDTEITGNVEYRKDGKKFEYARGEDELLKIMTSTDKKSAYVEQFLDENITKTLMKKKKLRDINNSPTWKLKDGTLKRCAGECLRTTSRQLPEAIYKEPRWGKPEPWQMPSLRLAQEKLLLAHRPGFGKTINALLLAEKMRRRSKKKVLLLAPNRDLLSQWVIELHKLGFDKRDYIWSTYNHFRDSQTKWLYPEYKDLNDFKDVYEDWIKKTKETSVGEYPRTNVIEDPYKKFPKDKDDEPRVRHCMVCGKEIQKSDFYGDEKTKLGKVLNGIVHEFDLGNNTIRIDHHWHLVEDKLFLACGCNGIKKQFLCGFPVDKARGATISEYRKIGYMKWLAFYNTLKRIAQTKKVQTMNQTVSELKEAIWERGVTHEYNVPYYMKPDGNFYHMYRAPKDCIIVCDEIHKFVRDSKSLMSQALWKYIAQSQYTILLSATPIESTNETKQLFILSELLKDNSMYPYESIDIDGTFNGLSLPPWHPLYPKVNDEDMYDLAKRIRGKFSRHNTVQDIDAAVDIIFDKDGDEDDRFKMDYKKLLNFYMGTDDDFLEGKIDKRLKEFLKDALKNLFVLQNKKRERIFPVLVPYRKDKDASPGYIEVHCDLNRALMKDIIPQYEIRYDIDRNARYNVEIKDHNIEVKKATAGQYSAIEIMQLEKWILQNKNGLINIRLSEDNVYLESAIVSNYTDKSDDIKAQTITDIIEKVTRKENITWLYVCPTVEVVAGGSNEGQYVNIPYIPDLLGSKVLEMVYTIEKQVSQSKNVMVYHDRVEMLRMLQRALTMRKHKYVNKFDKAQLENHAREQASKRYRKLIWQNDEEIDYVEKQEEAYGYNVDPSTELDYDELKEVFKFYNDTLPTVCYAIFYKKMERELMIKLSEKTFIPFAEAVNKFAYGAEFACSVSDKQTIDSDREACDKYIQAARIIKKMHTGKINKARKEKIIESATIYKNFQTEEKLFKKIIVKACENAFSELENPPKKTLRKKLDDLKPFPAPLVEQMDEIRVKYYAERSWTNEKEPSRQFHSTLKPKSGKPQTLLQTTMFSMLQTVKLPETDEDKRFNMPVQNFTFINSFIKRHDAFFRNVKQMERPENKMTIENFEYKLQTGDGFKDTVQTCKEAFVNCYFTRKYVNSMYDKYTEKLFNNAERVNNIDELLTILEHIEENPYANKKKGNATLSLNGEDMGERRTYVKNVYPRLRGMSEKNRMNFALIGGKVKYDNKKIKEWFENGSIDCLLVSDKGIEGIDYKSCSSSFMICIDPVKSAGKQDQFNGRTVRRNSHKNLPNSMRTVEYVSFVGTGLNRNQDTSEEDKKVEALRKRELIQYIKKNPLNSVASKVRVNELVRREKADKELKTLDKDENDWLVRARKLVRKEIYSKKVTINDEEGEEEMEVQEYVDDAKRKFDALEINYMDYKLIDTRTKQLLSADNELGCYITDKEYNVDEQFTKKIRNEITEDAIKLWILPNSIGTMDDGEKEEMLYRQKRKYNQLENNDEKRNLLQYEYKVDDFIVDPGINQLEISLGLRPSKFRQIFNLNIKRRRKVDVDIEDAKKWSTYFDNYVNLSHVPVFNNYAFTCLHDVNTTNKDHFCYACNKNRRMMDDKCEKCGLPLKVNGKYLYYHLVKTTEKPTEKTKDDLKETRNMKRRKQSKANRIQRDRLETMMTLNSIEHQMQLHGDRRYKFEYKENEESRTYYRRVTDEPLENTVPESLLTDDWTDLMDGRILPSTANNTKRVVNTKPKYVTLSRGAPTTNITENMTTIVGKINSLKGELKVGDSIHWYDKQSDNQFVKEGWMSLEIKIRLECEVNQEEKTVIMRHTPAGVTRTGKISEWQGYPTGTYWCIPNEIYDISVYNRGNPTITKKNRKSSKGWKKFEKIVKDPWYMGIGDEFKFKDGRGKERDGVVPELAWTWLYKDELFNLNEKIGPFGSNIKHLYNQLEEAEKAQNKLDDRYKDPDYDDRYDVEIQEEY